MISIILLGYNFVPPRYKNMNLNTPSSTEGYLLVMVKSNPVRPRTGPRYEPRSMLTHPQEFGRKINPEFVEETPANISQVSGARVQHVFAKGINDAVLERGMSLVTLSEMTGLNYQRLTRMLRGSVLMRIDDIGMIARALPESFDSVVGKYDPRARFNTTTPTKSRLSRIYEAARPLSNSRTEEPVIRQPDHKQGEPQSPEPHQPSTFSPPTYTPAIWLPAQQPSLQQEQAHLHQPPSQNHAIL